MAFVRFEFGPVVEAASSRRRKLYAVAKDRRGVVHSAKNRQRQSSVAVGDEELGVSAKQAVKSR
jgi:hypothetical protein